MRLMPAVATLFTLACAGSVPQTQTPAKSPPAPAAPQPARADRTEQDEYTRYELLPPETAQFHILYEVTAIAPGATVFFNPIRKGSEASGERVTDRMSGEALRFEVVSGEEARRTGLPGADLDSDYIRIYLPRPVPPDGGQVRLLIEKTYKDPKSYFREGDSVVFSRSLGIKRNSVVLPAGYELTGCNVPSQVLSEPDGRIRIAFYTDEKSYRLEGDELVFDRSFGRPHNAVVLPAGWYLTASAIPAAVSQMPDGRIRLDFVNPRPDEISVLIKARRRPGKNSHSRFQIPDSRVREEVGSPWNLESGIWNSVN